MEQYSHKGFEERNRFSLHLLQYAVMEFSWRRKLSSLLKKQFKASIHTKMSKMHSNL